MSRLRSSQRLAVANDSSDDVAIVEPPKSSQSVSTRLKHTSLGVDDDDDEDDDEPVLPSSTRKRRRPVVRLSASSEDDDDKPIIALSSMKRARPAMVILEDSSEEDVSPTKKRKTSHLTPERQRLERPTQPISSPVKQAPHKGHRSKKEKMKELLRRRRAGEKVSKLTSSEEESDEDKRGLYDTDPEEDMCFLKEFDDEETENGEEIQQLPQEDESKNKKERKDKKKDKQDENNEKKKRREKKDQKGSDEQDSNEKGDEEEDLDDFVVEDDDTTLLGAPANLDLPLEFTAQAHQPLRYQFKLMVEWLVQNKINPAFARDDPVYQNAWRKLDDEFRALASSKFSSSAWKMEFHRALNARPILDSYEMDDVGDHGATDEGTCEACGRRGHVASCVIIFSGHAYHKDKLTEVESEDSDSQDSDSEESDRKSYDAQGNPLPPQSKRWYVGVVCCENAKIAHSLIHWKYAQKQEVEERLVHEGWMEVSKLREREDMKLHKRRKVAERIVDGWWEDGSIARMYGEFKKMLEEARNRATSSRARFR